MSDKKQSGVPFSTDDAEEARLWSALDDMPKEKPSSQLRQSFYYELKRTTESPWTERLRDWLGFSGNAGWVTAAACVAVGMGMGQLLGGDPQIGAPDRLVALEENVELLNRNLILDRLENATASKRLRGVIDAVDIVEGDAEIARALLLRATDDRVNSVRLAAIDALGPQLHSPAVGDELMNMLEQAESPLVQLALVDLVLRNGTDEQLEYLIKLVDAGKLHAEIAQHVQNSVRRDQV